MTVTDVRRADPDLPIVRRVRFDFSDVPVHWVPGRPLVTHIANVFNILLPPGERWFCRSFRAALPAVEDDVLRDQVKAFIGQESIHGRSHHAYCDKLQADGIPALDLMAVAEERFTGPGERFPLEARLWLISGIEVYTAMLGRYVYETDVFDDAHPVMRDLLLWHLAEEIEHKSVAFDLAMSVDPSYRRRVTSGVAVTVVMLAQTTRLLVRLIAADPELTWRQAAREVWRERRQLADLARHGSRSFRHYLRRDHHPSQEADPPAALAYFAQSPAVARIGA
jgi:hypothetical protein